MSRRSVVIYKRFERFWHWMQALLIFLLAATGFEVHGSYELFGFDRAVSIHNRSAGALVILIAFAIFWHFTTGEWRQYVPTLDRVSAMVRFYLRGIFRGEPHPVKKTELSKLNPLQRLTYLSLKLVLIPLQIGSGAVYYYYNDLGLEGGVAPVALAHTIGTFLLLVFVIVHVYLTTTGHTIFSNLRAMVTGREDLEEG